MLNAKNLLRDYMLIPSGSGYEKRMAYRLKEDLAKYADEVKIDRLGNVIAYFKAATSNNNQPKVMLFAHMDQIGFVVTNIAENGYLRLNKNGSVPDKIVPGLALLVQTQDDRLINAVVGEKSYHVMSASEKELVTPIPSLFVDVGVRTKQEVLDLGINIGDSVVYRPHFEELQGSYVTGTSIDNRGGCVALVLCAEQLADSALDCDLYIVGSVQEEHNMHGAMTAANLIKPDIAIALDVCLASDSPGLEEVFSSATGDGPAINMYSFHGRGTLNGVIPSPGLVQLVKRVAQENKIKHSWFASRGILTDATYVQNVGQGVATIDLSFPVKYAHSPCEVCDTNDIVNLGHLCAKTIQSIDASFSLERY
jgi:putative aminopeptidase FrvX